MHNVYHAYRHVYEALGVKDIDQILPPPPKPQAIDPATENVLALNGKKFQAFPKQDHQAHMKAHLRFMGTAVVRNNPQALGALQQNCMEHILLMAQEQTELEFMEETQRVQQLQAAIQPMVQQMQMNPQMPAPPQVQQVMNAAADLQVRIESRKAALIGDFMDDYAKAESEVLNQMDNDPLLKLKDRELDIKARQEQSRKQEADEKLNMERAKILSNRQMAEDKLEQADEHAKLRASVSLAKDGIKSMKSTIVSGEE